MGHKDSGTVVGLEMENLENDEKKHGDQYTKSINVLWAPRKPLPPQLNLTIDHTKYRQNTDKNEHTVCVVLIRPDPKVPPSSSALQGVN